MPAASGAQRRAGLQQKGEGPASSTAPGVAGEEAHAQHGVLHTPVPQCPYEVIIPTMREGIQMAMALTSMFGGGFQQQGDSDL